MTWRTEHIEIRRNIEKKIRRLVLAAGFAGFMYSPSQNYWFKLLRVLVKDCQAILARRYFVATIWLLCLIAIVIRPIDWCSHQQSLPFLWMSDVCSEISGGQKILSSIGHSHNQHCCSIKVNIKSWLVIMVGLKRTG